MVAPMPAPEFVALFNDEGQYSLWPAAKTIPAGWRQEGEAGDRETCLAYIERVWTDMRPLSLRRAMDSRG